MDRVPETLHKHVLAYVREQALLRPGDRVGVAVSGGADSVALLRLMLDLRAELGAVLSVIHFNHLIRGAASDADERFVRDLAQAHGLPSIVSSGDTPAHAQTCRLSLETAARELRYGFFRAQLEAGALDKIATAHTLDDQAETVLLRLLRGAGMRGLAGIYPRVEIGSPGDHPAIVRPLLELRRPDLEHYLETLGQPWREDASNLDVKHTRNRVRHSLLPLLERDFNPAVRQRLAEMADIARIEAQHLERETAREAKNLLLDPATLPESLRAHRHVALSVFPLLELSLAVQRRIVRYVAASVGLSLTFDEVAGVLSVANPENASAVQLHDGWIACRGTLQTSSAPTLSPAGKSQWPAGRFIALHYLDTAESTRNPNYEYSFTWPGDLHIPQLGTCLQARLVSSHVVDPEGTKAEKPSVNHPFSRYNCSQLLNPHALTSELTVRNWRSGDRFWPAHTSAPRKIKELLQQRHVIGHERLVWPVIVSGGEIVWLRGFPVAEKFRADEQFDSALAIEEIRD